MKKLKVAVIGVGNMGTSHAKNIGLNGICPEMELVAICDKSPARQAWAKETFGEKVAVFGDAKDLFEAMQQALDGKVKAVRLSSRLKNHAVCLTSDGQISLEMEKVLNAMPDNPGVKAEKILEINPNHEVFTSLVNAYEQDKEKLDLYTKLLYNQALLIEGLAIEDPVEFTNDICKVMV